MRRFCVSPGERVELHPSFDDLTECVVFGFYEFSGNPIHVNLLLTPSELIQLAEACRMAAKDATTSTAED